MTPISQQIRAIISKHTGLWGKELSDDLRLGTDFGLDEFEIISLQGDIESDLDLQISDDQWSDIQTVGQLVAFAEAAMKAKG